MGLIKSKNIGIIRKSISFLPGIGYIIGPLIFTLFTLGILSFVTHAPGPMDIPLFVKETTFNILITSGLLIASIIALIKAKRFENLARMVVSSFSIGLVATYYVNKGIVKMLKRPIKR